MNLRIVAALLAVAVAGGCAPLGRPAGRYGPGPRPVVSAASAGEVRAEQFGLVCDGKTDTADALQQALEASSGKTLILPRVSAPCMIGRGLDLTGMTDLRLDGNGATIKFLASTPDTTSRNGDGGHRMSILRLMNSSRVTLREITLHGNLGERRVHPICEGGSNPGAECPGGVECRGGGRCTGQGVETFNHCVTLHTSTDVLLTGVRLEQCMTDGLYIGGDADGPSERIRVEHSAIVGNRRNNVSIVSGRDVSIVDTTIEDAGYDEERGTAPRAGIDIEPDDPRHHAIERIEMDRLSIVGSRGRYAVNITGEVPLRDVVLSRSEIVANRAQDAHGNSAAVNCQYSGEFVYPFTGGFDGVKIVENRIRHNGQIGVRTVYDACDAILGNRIEGHTVAGLTAWYARELLVEKNEFRGNGIGGPGDGSVIVLGTGSQSGFMSVRILNNRLVHNRRNRIKGWASSCTNTAGGAKADDCATPFDPAEAIAVVSGNESKGDPGRGAGPLVRLDTFICAGGANHGANCAGELEPACAAGGGICRGAGAICTDNRVNGSPQPSGCPGS